MILASDLAKWALLPHTPSTRQTKGHVRGRVALGQEGRQGHVLRYVQYYLNADDTAEVSLYRDGAGVGEGAKWSADHAMAWRQLHNKA